MEITRGEEEVKSSSHEVHGSTIDKWDAWTPAPPPRRPAPPDLDIVSTIKLMNEGFDEIDEMVATSRRTNIIIRDRTPESTDADFWDVLPRLTPILEADDVRRLLKLFDQHDRGLAYGFIITPLTFTEMVKHNALRCAKVALESKAPVLCGYRANPNCMNCYGYFPLHETAQTFSVDMIKLLIRYGASANVLPLHVAVENTCLHKYLEDNVFLSQEDLDNNQKIFLDTTRLLGEHK